jgi:hypothetical protein
MTNKVFAAIGVLIFGALAVGVARAQNTSPITGQWTLSNFVVPDYVQLGLQRTAPGLNTNSSSPVLLSRLAGLTQAQLASSGSTVRFSLVRDAGTLEFQGFVQGGAGGGTFVFSPNLNYALEMSALGYPNLNAEKVFSMALHDVGTAYVRDFQSMGIRPESADKLVSMRIHGVTPQFVRELNSRGYNSVSPDKLVSMRIHGVTTEFIDQVQALGYAQPAIDQLVSMRIHGITPELIRRSQSLGIGNISINKLVDMKIHGLLK